MTAMRARPRASSARSAAKRLAAASTRSPDGAEIDHGAAAWLRQRRRRRPAAPRPSRTSRASSRSLARRRVVARQHARRRRACPARRCASAIGWPSTRSMLSRGNAAEPQQHRLGAGHIDHGQFQPERRRPAVEDHGDAVAEIGLHMRRGGRADVAGAVGAGRRDRPTGAPQQRLRHRMRRHPQRDGVEPGGGQIRHRAIRPASCSTRVSGPARTRPPSCRPPSVRRPSARRRLRIRARARSAD